MFVAAYNVKDYARIEKEFNGEMSTAITSDKLKEFIDETQSRFGKITKLAAPKFGAPGEMNRMYFPGNLLIIKHADGEFSLFAHFKQNLIRVKVGDKVTKGQIIGLCGNSGNSSEPHLHYQFQDAPFFAEEASMKVFFEKLNVKRESKTEAKTEYSPVKGDFISN